MAAFRFLLMFYEIERIEIVNVLAGLVVVYIVNLGCRSRPLFKSSYISLPVSPLKSSYISLPVSVLISRAINAVMMDGSGFAKVWW